MIVPDLNLLLYAVDESAPHHPDAKAWWEAALNGTRPIGLAWSVALGFVRLSTSSRVYSHPLGAEEALDYLDAWRAAAAVRFVEPTDRHLAVLRGLLREVGTAGNLTTDAHLAALAVEHGAELFSADHDFGRFPGLRWRNPLARA